MSGQRPSRLVRRLLHAPTRLYDWHLGWLLGHRFLRLHHVGRRSGCRHQSVLEVVGYTATGDVVVVAGFGPDAHWYRNVQANPTVEIDLGRRHFRATMQRLDERQAVHIVADFERRNRLAGPVIRRVLSWLLRDTYDGSDAARQRLVQQLPVVAFTPRPTSGPRRAEVQGRWRDVQPGERLAYMSSEQQQGQGDSGTEPVASRAAVEIVDVEPIPTTDHAAAGTPTPKASGTPATPAEKDGGSERDASSAEAGAGGAGKEKVGPGPVPAATPDQAAQPVASPAAPAAPAAPADPADPADPAGGTGGT